LIQIAHKYKRKIGICGQAPSDYPEFAEMLVREGIDSISLNPDTVISTRERIAHVEKTLGKMGKKTSAKFLSLIITIGILAGVLISIGAGCTNAEYEKQMNEVKNYVENVNLAQVRTKIEEKIIDKMKSQMLVLKESGFAEFSLQYPVGWTVEHGEDNITFRDEKSGDYFFISAKGMKGSEKVATSTLTTSSIDGWDAVRYQDALPDEQGGAFEAVEIGKEPNILFVRGKGDKFNTILESIKFSN